MFLWPGEHFKCSFRWIILLYFITRSCNTQLPVSTSTPVQAGNCFQLGAKTLISPIMSYHCVCLLHGLPPTCLKWVPKESIDIQGKLTVGLCSKIEEFFTSRADFKRVRNKMAADQNNGLCCHLDFKCKGRVKVQSRHWYKKSINKKFYFRGQITFSLGTLVTRLTGYYPLFQHPLYMKTIICCQRTHSRKKQTQTLSVNKAFTPT